MSLHNYNKDDLLLINHVKNNTNGNIQIITPTKILNNLIKNKKNQIKLITIKELYATCMLLGINVETTLESREKAMTLANYLNAKYVLYSIIEGNIKQPKIILQLMLAKNGEIIWEGKNMVIIENN